MSDEKWLALLALYAIGTIGRRSLVTGTALDTTKLVWPVKVPTGARSVISQEYRPGPHGHPGVDIVVPAPAGKSPRYLSGGLVVAVADGIVTRAARGQRGWWVLLDHGDWASGYLHLSSALVGDGQRVEAGQTLGPMGADPLDPEQVVHLHIQISARGQLVDPARYLPA